MKMRFVLSLFVAAVLALPMVAVAQDDPGDKPVDNPPPDNPPDNPPDPPPDDPGDNPGDTPPDAADAEKLRLKLVEKDARAKADELRKRMTAAKTDTERSQAIVDLADTDPVVQHPILVAELLVYLNPRQIKAGLRYGETVQTAAISALKKQPFDETFYGVKKYMMDNLSDTAYVIRLITLLGELKNTKAIPQLVTFLKDKRDGFDLRAREAAISLGKIGHRDAIPALIAELEEEDKAGGSDEKMKKRRENLNRPVADALTAITGQTFKLGSQWRSWWIKNVDTFQKEKKVPDPGGDTPGETPK